MSDRGYPEGTLACGTCVARAGVHVAAVLEGRGIRAQPPVGEAGLYDWIVLSLPVMPAPDDSSPDPRPSDEWFEHLMSVVLVSEREVEMSFASPLLHGLGYCSEHEAAGFRFDTWEEVTRRRIEADLVYFADERNSLDDGVPLVLVEAKGSDQAPDAGTGQAKSYAYWLKPAYYVTTNGQVVVVYNYQGGAVPDVKVLDFKRSELRERFDDLYRVLNPKAAAVARQAKSTSSGGPHRKSPPLPFRLRRHNRSSLGYEWGHMPRGFLAVTM